MSNDDIKDGNDTEHKDTFTGDELLEDIQKEDPTFKPNEKIHQIYRHKHNLDDYPILTFTNIEETPPAPLEYIMHPIMPSPSIIFVYAATGVGKTLFTLNLAYAIAGGGSFLKYSCPKPRKILYIDGEMPYNQIHARLKLIEQQQGKLFYKDNFLLITPDKCPAIPQIDNEDAQEFYSLAIQKYGIEAIVFDNISTLTNIDENKAHEWKPIQDWQIKLRASGVTIINVHHAGKDKNGYRGTSRMLDVADLAISLQPQVDDQIDDTVFSKKFKVIYHKPRHLLGKDGLPFEVILDNGIWTYQSIEMSILDKVIDCVNAGMNQQAIAKELFISQPTVHRLIKKARFSGRVKM